MESLLFLLKGVLIGLLFGVPIGAVGTMTVGRALNHGFGAGIITGIGSSVSDCIYAAIGAFGLTMISDFLLKYETVVQLFGGCLVVAMGISAFFKKQTEAADKKPTDKPALMFLSAFAVGIANPTAILTFLFAFTYFDLDVGMNAVGGVLLILGVLIGTFLCWLTLSGIASKFQENVVKHKTVSDRIFGVLLVVFGGSILIGIII